MRHKSTNVHPLCVLALYFTHSNDKVCVGDAVGELCSAATRLACNRSHQEFTANSLERMNSK